MLLIFLTQASVRILAYPFFILLYLMKVGFFHRRICFERRNYHDHGCRPFTRVGKRAHCLFHFSSEGEFEQIRPLADELISNGKNIELIFTSASVEDKVVAYYQSHRENVRYLRLPILIYFPLLSRQNIIAWSSAKKMLMVRYDFFPELLYLGTKMQEFILFSATAKSSKARYSKDGSLKVSPIKKFIYSQFDRIICATNDDLELFKQMEGQVVLSPPIELRMIQINNRQNSFRKHPYYDCLNRLLSFKDYKNRLCLAQTWPNELVMFKDEKFCREIINGSLFVVMAPHILKSQNIEDMKELMASYAPKLPLYIVDESHLNDKAMTKLLSQYIDSPGPFICTLKGVLCEIYPYFKRVFVGGGHGKGVHSLLEPYVAGATLSCGPNVHRSTEYDTIIKAATKVFLIEDLTQVAWAFCEQGDVEQLDVDNRSISDMIKESELEKKKLIQLLIK